MDINKAHKKVQAERSKQEELIYAELLREAEARGLLIETGVKPPATFKQFVKRVAPEIEWHPFVEQLADLAERIANHELTRVMVWIPPQLGKSTIFSRLLSAYYLLKHPNRKVAVASYGYEVAEGFTYDALLYYKTWGGILDPQSQAKGNWRTDKMGQCRAFGVGGPVLGATWHLGILDDPHKGAEEVFSPTKREKTRDWFDSKWRTRANPIGDTPACYVICQQRWSDSDMSAWLLARENPESWHVVCLEAVKEAEPVKIPANCTLEPDPRATGEVLWPARLTPERVAELKSNTWFWNCQYQQRPGKAVGSLCERSQFQFVETSEVPEFRTLYRSWDTAGKEKKDADFTVGIHFGYDNAGNIWILDMVREQIDTPDVRQLILDIAVADPPGTVVAVEDATASMNLVQDLQRDPLFLKVPFVPVKIHGRSGNLLSRSAGLFALIRTGRMKVVKGSWTEDFVEEFLRFSGQKSDTDDVVSACNIGFQAVLDFGGGSITHQAPINPYSAEYVRALHEESKRMTKTRKAQEPRSWRSQRQFPRF